MSDSDRDAPVVRNRVRRRRERGGSNVDHNSTALSATERDDAQEVTPVAESKTGDIDDNSKDRDAGGSKEDEPLLESKPISDSAAAGSITPKKPEKPKKPTRNIPSNQPAASGAASSSGAGANTSVVDSNHAKRAIQGPPQPTWFTFLSKSMCCKLGYRMEPFYRDVQLTGKYVSSDGRTDPFILAAVVERVQASAAFVTSLVRPMIRMHCVYLNTGHYIKGVGMPPAAPSTTGTTAALVIHILPRPFQTLTNISSLGPCPLNKPSAMPYWNETLPIIAPFTDVAAPATLLLFELLDDRPSLRPRKSSNQRSAFKRIAWGYLMPVGTRGQLNVGVMDSWKANASNSPPRRAGQRIGRLGGGRNVEGSAEENDDSDALIGQKERNERPVDDSAHDLSVCVQLYSYATTDGILGSIQRGMMGWPTLLPTGRADEAVYPDNVPSVYVQWRRQNLLPIEGANLALSLGPRPVAAVAQPVLQTGNVEQVSGLSALGTRASMGGKSEDLTRKDFSRAKAATIKRTRGLREVCLVPDKLLHRLEVGPEGAMVVAFSHSGHLLAVAAKTVQVNLPFCSSSISSPYPGNTYALRLIDTDTGMEVWSDQSAHFGVIYDIRWSLDDTYILTCSGDGTSKVYDVMSVSPLAKEVQRDRERTQSQSAPNSSSSPSKRQSGNFDTDTDGDRPSVLHTLINTPPGFVYAAIFQEYSAATLGGGASSMAFASGLSGVGISDLTETARNPLPRVITGSADGRIRVWEKSALKGFIVMKGGHEGNGMDAPPAHTDAEGKVCRVQALTIDERSRYLISGASDHSIYVWKRDDSGWHQLQRTFKQDASLRKSMLGATLILDPGASMKPGMGITSLSMHPEKGRSQLLALSHSPGGAMLRLLSTSTYKQLASFSGMGVDKDGRCSSVFARCSLSADGRLSIGGVQGDVGSATQGKYNLRVWDSSTGHHVPSALSEITLPYPVRSIAWHPKQHVVAVAMVGTGACVSIFCADRGASTCYHSSSITIHHIPHYSLHQFNRVNEHGCLSTVHCNSTRSHCQAG